MIKSSLVGLVLAAAIQATSPELQESEHVKAVKKTTKQKVSKIVIDDYYSIAERLKKLKEYNGGACKIVDSQFKNIGDTKLFATSYSCKTPRGSSTKLQVLQAVGLEKRISKDKSCVDLGIYFGDGTGQSQVGIGALVTVENGKGSEDIFYTDISCEQLFEGKIKVIKEIRNKRRNST